MLVQWKLLGPLAKTSITSSSIDNHIWFKSMPHRSNWTVHWIPLIFGLCNHLPQLDRTRFAPHHVGPYHTLKAHWHVADRTLTVWLTLGHYLQTTPPNYTCECLSWYSEVPPVTWSSNRQSPDACLSPSPSWQMYLYHLHLDQSCKLDHLPLALAPMSLLPCTVQQAMQDIKQCLALSWPWDLPRWTPLYWSERKPEGFLCGTSAGVGGFMVLDNMHGTSFPPF